MGRRDGDSSDRRGNMGEEEEEKEDEAEEGSWVVHCAHQIWSNN